MPDPRSTLAELSGGRDGPTPVPGLDRRARRYGAVQPGSRRPRGRGPAASCLPVHARRRLGRPAPDGVVLWTRLAPDPLTAAACRAGACRSTGRWRRRGMRRRRPPRASRWPRPSSATPCTSRWRASSRARVLLPVQVPAARCSPVGRTDAARRARTSARCASRSPPASAGRTATTPPTGTWPTRTSTSSSTSATTSTSTAIDAHGGYRNVPVPEQFRPDRRRSSATACSTRSTRATPTCSGPTAVSRGSSPGTTTRSRTTTPAPSADGSDPTAGVPGAAGGRLPGVLRAHAAARSGRCRAAATCALYRRLRFGDLRELQRARHAPVPHRPAVRRRRVPALPGGLDPARRCWARSRRRWLLDGLDALARALERARAAGDDGASSTTRAAKARCFWQDGWDGYPLARQRLLEQLVAAQVRNPVVLTGDWHSTS